MALGRKTGLLCLFPSAIHRTGNGRMKRVCTINLRWATGRTARYIRE
jgi:hypothetical protein